MVKGPHNELREKAILRNRPAFALRKKMLPQVTQQDRIAEKHMHKKKKSENNVYASRISISKKGKKKSSERKSKTILYQKEEKYPQGYEKYVGLDIKKGNKLRKTKGKPKSKKRLKITKNLDRKTIKKPNLEDVSRKKLREKQLKFSVFMNLLKELKEGNKISAEALRDHRKNWENYPQNRKILTDNLSTKLTKIWLDR